MLAETQLCITSVSIVDSELSDHHGERSEIMVRFIPKISSLCGGGSGYTTVFLTGW